MIEVLYFSAPWCGPCKTMGPIFDNIKKEFKVSCTFTKIDASENKELVSKYNIAAVPTFIFLEEDEELMRRHGVFDLTGQLQSLLPEY